MNKDNRTLSIKITCLSSVEYKEHLFVQSVKLKDARIVFF